MRILFNLRSARLREFWRLNPTGSLGDIVSKLLVWVKQGGLPKKEVRARYRKCLQCPVRDSEKNQCFMVHPTSGSEMGCGCYIPYLIQVDQNCWAKKQNPNGKFGWGKTEHNDGHLI